MLACYKKIVIIGDAACGKTSLLNAFCKKSFSDDYTPTGLYPAVYQADIDIGSERIKLDLKDTSGDEKYDRMRPASYLNVDIVLLCFDVTSPNSFENIRAKWFDEASHYLLNVPMMLVGNKIDLRDDEDTMKRLLMNKQKPVAHSEGKEIGFEIGALAYFECSAMNDKEAIDLQSANKEVCNLYKGLRINEKRLLNKERELMTKEQEFLNKEQELLHIERELRNQLQNEKQEFLGMKHDLLNKEGDLRDEIEDMAKTLSFFKSRYYALCLKHGEVPQNPE